MKYLAIILILVGCSPAEKLYIYTHRFSPCVAEISALKDTTKKIRIDNCHANVGGYYSEINEWKYGDTIANPRKTVWFYNKSLNNKRNHQ